MLFRDSALTQTASLIRSGEFIALHARQLSTNVLCMLAGERREPYDFIRSYSMRMAGEHEL